MGILWTKDWIASIKRWEKVYSDKWINDYHFIFLGSEKSYTQELGSTQAYISKEQMDWLTDKLAEKYEPGKPIFIFLHQHLSGSTANNQFRWVGVKQDEEVKAILSKYKEAIIFTSHTHASLTSTNKYITNPFTAMHTGAISNAIEPDGNGGRRNIESSQGLYIEVLDDNVVVKGRDFINKIWINDALNILKFK